MMYETNILNQILKIFYFKEQDIKLNDKSNVLDMIDFRIWKQYFNLSADIYILMAKCIKWANTHLTFYHETFCNYFYYNYYGWRINEIGLLELGLNYCRTTMLCTTK